jgi:hypothetical protein
MKAIIAAFGLFLGLTGLSSHAATWVKLTAATGAAGTWHKLCAAPAGAATWHQVTACTAGFAFNATIATNTQNYNLRTAAIAAGWNQTDPLVATVTINSGVYVTRHLPPLHHFQQQSFPGRQLFIFLVKRNYAGVAEKGNGY